jgi:hypothetical protein
VVIEATYGWSLRHELAHRHIRAPGDPHRRDVLCARSVRVVSSQIGSYGVRLDPPNTGRISTSSVRGTETLKVRSRRSRAAR